MEQIAHLYWIYNSTCSDPKHDGYVGVTNSIVNRFKAHLLHNRVPSDCSIKILFTGERSRCFELENSYRPVKAIGWNNAPGGARGNRLGFNHSAESKAKMSAAWTPKRRQEHAKRLVIHNQKLIGQKRPKQSVSISGEKNGMFGKTHSEEARRKISDFRKGKSPSNKSNTMCQICMKEASPSILRKYHGHGKKNCK